MYYESNLLISSTLAYFEKNSLEEIRFLSLKFQSHFLAHNKYMIYKSVDKTINPSAS